MNEPPDRASRPDPRQDHRPAQRPADQPSNRLAGETSAYLRQHMHNPVDWYPWGEEALGRAAAEDRPLLVSIGYSACHWCHVMERESFEDPGTAALMNELFVNIKVDREERPDVDQIYMDTVVGLTGHGGWPLTIFCAPDGRPFYAGTYFPPEPRHGMPAFRQVVEAIARTYREQRDKVEESAEQIMAALRSRPGGVASEVSGRTTLTEAARELMQNADRRHGGFGRGPKFPTPTSLDLVLASLDLLPEEEARDALEFLVFSCREMSRRGLYDQLGGGFHRYCVDEHWGIPHFEKMLYDQGQLMKVYADTWRRAGAEDDDLLWPVRETAAYLRREMTGPEGGFYASQDADSEGEEGKFYTWTPEQVEAALGKDEAVAFCETYGVTDLGNFEGGGTVLWDGPRKPREELRSEREALYQVRSGRVWPGTDRKRLASWNGLAISGLAYAGSLLGDEAMLKDARAACDFVLERLTAEDGRLRRVFNEDRVHTSAFLDDVSAMLAATLDLHRAGAGHAYFEAALGFADQIATHFFDAEEADLFLTPDDGERLVHRPRSDHDGATPHSAGLAVLGLLRAASLSGREDLRRVADQVIRTHAFALERAALAYPTLLRAAAWAERGLSSAVIVGDAAAPATAALARRARRVLDPEEGILVVAPGDAAPPGIDQSWLTGRDTVGGEPAAYVCRGTTCSLPVTTPGELVAFGSRLEPEHG